MSCNESGLVAWPGIAAVRLCFLLNSSEWPITIDDYKKILAKGHLYRALYHFTDRSNLESIDLHGIVSKKEALARGIEVTAFGGNEWSHDADRHKGIEDYVSLCFTTSHPMCYVAQVDGRLSNPVYVSIDPDVLALRGVQITLGVANKAESILLEVEEALEQLDRQVLYSRTDWSDP